jgi:hypothetical protein
MKRAAAVLAVVGVLCGAGRASAGLVFDYAATLGSGSKLNGVSIVGESISVQATFDPSLGGTKEGSFNVYAATATITVSGDVYSTAPDADFYVAFFTSAINSNTGMPYDYQVGIGNGTLTSADINYYTAATSFFNSQDPTATQFSGYQ